MLRTETRKGSKDDGHDFIPANVRPAKLSDADSSDESVKDYSSPAIAEENAKSGGHGEYALVHTEVRYLETRAPLVVARDCPAL